MENKLLLFVLAALALMGSPGPATLSSAAMGSAFGIARGARYVAGICSGTITVLILVATGVTGLILSHPTMATLISVLAAAYIVYLAYRIATAPVGNAGPKAGTSPSVLAGYLLAISNPKAYAAIGAVYSGTILVPNALLADAL
ncbi:MAG: LysE family transporter, partial [Pseudomonadota bacterium]